MTDQTCKEFIDKLASSAPVPGGGGASALVGALGAALGAMVANLTSGKKKYADVQQDIERLLAQAEILIGDLSVLIDKDAEVFEPLSKAYGLPQNTPEEKTLKEATLEAALRTACEAPLAIMEKAAEAIELHKELAQKGSRIAISDVGVGVLFCKSALMGASLNIFINTKLMKDRQYAEELNVRTRSMISRGAALADSIYKNVEDSLQ
ncbi:MAG: cyclodeaminase/cyclohydrolase family protein [Bacillota bacterium]